MLERRWKPLLGRQIAQEEGRWVGLGLVGGGEERLGALQALSREVEPAFQARGVKQGGVAALGEHEEAQDLGRAPTLPPGVERAAGVRRLVWVAPKRDELAFKPPRLPALPGV